MMHWLVSQGSETELAPPVFDREFYSLIPGCIVHLPLNLLILYGRTKERGKGRKGLFLCRHWRVLVLSECLFAARNKLPDCWWMTPT